MTPVYREIGWRCYLATIADYRIVCCEAVRSAILATAWLLVVSSFILLLPCVSYAKIGNRYDCPSVRLYVTLWHNINITRFSPQSSPRTWFQPTKGCSEIWQGFYAGVRNTEGVGRKSRICSYITLYHSLKRYTLAPKLRYNENVKLHAIYRGR